MDPETITATRDYYPEDLGNAIEVMYGPYKYDGAALLRQVKSLIKNQARDAQRDYGRPLSDREVAIGAVCEWLGLEYIEELVAAVKSECPECGTPTCTSCPANDRALNAVLRVGTSGLLEVSS